MVTLHALKFEIIIQSEIDDDYNNLNDIEELIAADIYETFHNGEDFFEVFYRGAEEYEDF